MGLTPKQSEVWRFVTQYTQMNGRSPTLEEIADGVDLRAVSTVHRHLENLKALGLIDKIPHGKRALRIRGAPEMGMKIQPYRCYRIFQGNQALPIDKDMPLFDKLPQPLMGLEVGDGGYEEYGIMEGDWLLVHEREQVESGKLTAIELVNGVILVRRAVWRGDRTVFESLDESNQLDLANVKILGTVVMLVRKV